MDGQKEADFVRMLMLWTTIVHGWPQDGSFCLRYDVSELND